MEEEILKLWKDTNQSRTPSFLVTIGLLNTKGRVEEFLVARELWINHKKLIFFPVASVATYTDSHLEVDQRRRPCERDGQIGRILGLVATANPAAF
ncbi:hypothetical protein Taro_001589 [Colocasia esculenta]|uniref:Uncharacterized protein n=1 Tax=Colocasia esculenta TaxID=4460 RepID=A0A843TGN4_COLES|nr:hypothetical protein [Colocasia esculenta]